MAKQFFKMSADFGDYKKDVTYPVEDGELALLTKGKLGIVVEAPADLESVLQKAREEVIDRLASKIAGKMEIVGAKSNRPGYAPSLVVKPDNVLEDPTDGFKTGADFYMAVHKAATTGHRDDRLLLRLKANGASENVNADGGYATPVQYATTIFNDVIAQDSLLNQCFTIPMESNSMKLPALNYTKQGSFGVTAYWEGEGAAIPPSKTPYRQPQLVLNKLTVLTPVTNELLEDGIAVEATINYLAGEALTYKINDAIINGTGAGQPVGVVGHPSTVAVARQTALSVTFNDVTGMDSAFNGDDNRAMWLISKVDVNPKLLQIQDPGGRALYFAPGTFGDVKGPANMLGNRIRPLINCQPVGNAGDIILWDPKSYVVGFKRTGIQKAMSIHVYFTTDEVAYRWTIRMDGRPWRDTTLQAAKSSLAYGTAVTLATKLS